MAMHEFTVVARGMDPSAPDFETRFYEAGCDDATVSFQKGRILLDFSREAGNVGTAVMAALADVAKAGAVPVRVEPDHLASMSEIARRSGISRQAISYYAEGSRGENFPAPVACVTTDRPLWDWAAVARWLHDDERVGDEVLDHAEAVRTANRMIAATSLGG